MASDPIIYCLQEVTDYSQFERLCHDLMAGLAYGEIEPLGGFKDAGRDAVHISRSTGEIAIFAYSVREDWRAKLQEDAEKIRGHGHACEKFVFVTTSKLTAGDRDKAIEDVRRHFGWTLELFGIERLRVLLGAGQQNLIAMHPSIFNPAFFANVQPSNRRADVLVRANPTRQKRRQLAQLMILNRGNAPVLLKQWVAHWGPPGQSRAFSSIDTVNGRLPIRLDEQEECSLTFPIDQHPVDLLEKIGVNDAEGRTWAASEENVREFVWTASTFPPPEPVAVGPTKDELRQCEVAIDVQARHRERGPDVLEVIFLNKGPFAVHVDHALIEWRFDPPRARPSAPGAPQVAEASGSINLARETKDRVAQPGSAIRFRLSDDVRDILQAVLSADVRDDGIVVGVVTDTGLAWEEKSPEVAKVIRSVARSIVESWDR